MGNWLIYPRIIKNKLLRGKISNIMDFDLSYIIGHHAIYAEIYITNNNVDNSYRIFINKENTALNY